MLETATHLFWNRAAVFFALFLIWDGYQDLKKNSEDKRALVRLIGGIITLVVDYIFLKSWGVNLLGG